jgi:uncharacterized membrane protein
MTSKATITVHKPREDVQRLWTSSEYQARYAEAAEAVVFKDAPGDRGTEIYVDLGDSGPVGKLGAAARSLVGGASRPKVKDDLRRFKQQVETGEIPRSDGSPEGERAERKLKQRPAQPLEQSELDKAGVR